MGNKLAKTFEDKDTKKVREVLENTGSVLHIGGISGFFLFGTITIKCFFTGGVLPMLLLIGTIPATIISFEATTVGKNMQKNAGINACKIAHLEHDLIMDDVLTDTAKDTLLFAPLLKLVLNARSNTNEEN